MSVPAHDLAALGIARCAPGPALVHRVPDVVVDPDGDGGVAGDLLDRLGADQAVALELAGQASPDSSTRASRGTWTTTK